VAQAVAREERSGDERCDEADEVDGEEVTELLRREMERSVCEIERDVAEDRDQREQHAEADAEGGEEAQVAQAGGERNEAQFAWRCVAWRGGFREEEVGGDGSDGEQDTEDEEDHAPTGVRGDDAAEEAAEEASENGACDVAAHGTRDAERLPLFGDIGDGEDEDAGSDEALQEAPCGEHVERGGGGCEDGADGKQGHRENDDALAREGLAESGEKQRRDSYADSRCADGERDVCFRGVEDVGEEREERLRAVEIEEGDGAAEEDGEVLREGA